MRKKVYAISIFEVILCLFVVLIHLLSECIAGYEKGSFLCAASFFMSRSLSFAVPSFIMISAIKLNYKFNMVSFNYKTFIKSRFTKIYIPYVIWVFLYYLYFTLCEKYFPFSLKTLAIFILNGDIAAPFYFIITIMQFYIIFPIIMYICKNYSSKIILPICFIVTIVFSMMFDSFVYADRIFIKYLIYFVIGAYIGLNYDTAIKFLKTQKKVLITLSLFLIIGYDMMSYLEFMGKFHSFSTEIIKIVLCLVVPLTFLSVLRENKNKLVDKISPLTYYIYLLHCLLIFICEKLLTQHNIRSISLRFVIKSLVVYVLSLSGSAIYYSIKKRLKKPKI